MINPEDVNLVIYHAGCTDGFGSAWAAWKLLGSKAKYLSWRAGASPPDVTGKVVVVCDLSFKKDEMIRLLEEAKEIIVLDHHKTAEENLRGVKNCFFDLGHSGAMLSWNFFHPNVEPPDLIKYIEDKDLWRFSLPWSKEINSSIDNTDFKFEEFDKLNSKDGLNAAREEGVVINAFITKLVEHSTKNLAKKMIGCHTASVINTLTFKNEFGHEMCKTADIAVMWNYDHNESLTKVSLRSKGEVDVGNIARQWGGGGHKTSSGFILPAGQSIESIFSKNDMA